LVMPTCPACGTHIDSLDCYILDTSETYVLYVDGYGRVVKQYDDSLEGISIRFYRCPECRNPLFTEYEDAVNFLRGL